MGIVLGAGEYGKARTGLSEGTVLREDGRATGLAWW
jgi:hypothetical protein